MTLFYAKFPLDFIFAKIAKITLNGIVWSECSTCVTFAKNDSSMLTFCNIVSSSRNSPQLILFCVISSNTSNLQNHAQWYCFRRMFHMCQYCEKRRADGHFLQFWQSCWTKSEITQNNVILRDFNITQNSTVLRDLQIILEPIRFSDSASPQPIISRHLAIHSYKKLVRPKQCHSGLSQNHAKWYYFATHSWNITNRPE